MSEPDVHRRATGPVDIDPDRLLRRIRELGRIGRDPSTGGITRPGFSAADREGRAYLVGEARAASLTSRVDAAGNLFFRAPGGGRREEERRPVLLIGSHLDTVIDGGRLDGAYGVLAALEVLQAGRDAGLRGRCEPVAVAFANEEGALFPQPFFGSMVLAGRLADLPAEPRDHRGGPLRGELARAGGDLDALGSAVWSPDALAGYLELHIEQGPVLEGGGQPIGVVDAITGRCVLTVEVRGAAGHAGTTPMEARHDPVPAACQVALGVEAVSRERGLCRVSTVGRMDIHPNSANTIAGRVRLTVDLRDTDARRMTDAEDALREVLRTVAGRTGTAIEIVSRVRSEPVATCPRLCGAIEASADELGLAHVALPSGAGHDAQIVAGIAPVAMIFVPSIAGVSHHPEEDTAPADLVAGARVLLRTVLRAAGLRAGSPLTGRLPV